MSSVEEIRLSYKPDKVAVLFIGESAPAKGTFFYTGDSLCTYTREAFSMAFPGRIPSSAKEFLRLFQRVGCYLDDLCLVPVNDRTTQERSRLHRESMPGLAARIREYQPQAVVCMLKGGEFPAIVSEAVRRAGLADVPFRITPFGGFGNQGKYREAICEYLLEFETRGILRIPE
jgi:hypothetical protein